MSAAAPVHVAHRPDLGESPARFTPASLEIVRAMIEAVFAATGLDANAVRGRSVLVKPNLVRPQVAKLPAMCTDPRVICGLLEVLRDLGAGRISVGENPGYELAACEAFRDGGLDELIAERGAQLVCLDEDEPLALDVPGAVLLRRPLLPRALERHDLFINLPKLKTHMHTLVSLGLKNLHGLLYDCQRLLFHRGDIDQKIVDIYLAARPDYTLIDGLWAMEGQAPFFGDPIPDMGVLVGGPDTVAVDATACRLMGIEPAEVAVLRIAAAMGLGDTSPEAICLSGAPLAQARRTFKRPVLTSTGLARNVRVIEGGACRGCLSALRHSLDKLAFDGRLEKLPPTTIYIGKPQPNVENLATWGGDLWLFGACAMELCFYDPARRSRAHLLPGCPPHVLDWARRVEDRAEDRILPHGTDPGAA